MEGVQVSDEEYFFMSSSTYPHPYTWCTGEDASPVHHGAALCAHMCAGAVLFEEEGHLQRQNRLQACTELGSESCGI